MDYDYLKNKKILLVDDEQELLQMISSFFIQDGYEQLRTASTVGQALETARLWKPELAVLDVMLPDGNGFSLFKALKQFADIPVLFLSARGEDEDRLHGLGLGADDYIVKPFLPQELLLRVNSILRRWYREENPRIQLAGSQIDFQRAEVLKGKERLPLTAKEYEILQTLCRNAGRIVSIDQLCEAAWGDNPYGYENSLMAHIRRIWEKIELTPSHPVSLITVKGLGYKLIVEGKSS